MAAAMRRSTNLLVGFDMGGTVAVLRNETMHQHTLRVYRKLGMIPAEVTDIEILDTIASVRRIFEGAGEAHEDRDAFWLAINTIVLDRLVLNPHHRRSISAYARNIHESFLAKEDFRACPVMIDIVRKLRAAGARVVITSNSTHHEAEELLGHLGLIREFNHVFTSDALGARKTQEDFWSTVVSRAFPEGVPADLTAVQVGNSLFSDGFAARYGWRTVIVDRDQRYAPHTEYVELNAQFTEPHRLQTQRDIQCGAVKFVRSPEKLRDLFVRHGYTGRSHRRRRRNSPHQRAR